MINSNIINNYHNSLSYKSNQIKKLICIVFNSEKISKAQLSIILSTKNHLNELKKEYFNLDHYTDVIAFNLGKNKNFIEGEIYISIDDVYENSNLYTVSFNEEFKRVLIHGLLHLLGYEDSEKREKEKMQRLEDKYLLNFTKEIIKLKC